MSVTLAALDDEPYAPLARLREASPVVWAPALDAWLVMRRDDVLAVLRDPDTFSTDSPRSPIRDVLGAQMLGSEGEMHRRYKSHCAPPFNARAVREVAGPVVEREVDRLMDTLAASDRAELRATLAGPLAVFSVGRAIGLPVELHAAMREWYDELASALATFDRESPERRRGRRRAAEVRALVRSMLPSAAGGDAAFAGSLLRTLALAPDRLADEEIAANVLIVLFGGIETTEAAIANAAWALLGHPEQLAAVRADPSLLPNAIEESLRWEPAVQTCTRFATRAARIRGVEIAAGETVQCMLGAANRDPAHFPDPDRFDARRANAGDHLTFGAGRHFCLGALLARHEARLALARLLDRLPALRLDPDRPSRPRGHEFRKPPELWVLIRPPGQHRG